MASLNKVILIGYLGADPEIKALPNGDAVAGLRIATSESWKDKNSGERKEATEWHRVVLFRRLAEIAEQYLRKGSQVYLEGRIRTSKWQDKEGNDCYMTEIVGSELKMLGKRAADEEREPAERNARQVVEHKMVIEDDDIPF